ncbi:MULTISPECIES: hypothetical protein [unclassified Nocardia]|uniref:hypothetical protein n=1 Tax=unclassified Nocardia TaxID=2637762 RepID=UPI001CE46AC5|nr:MULTISPECIES: hypothetical protein [unclassified Nocardia]
MRAHLIVDSTATANGFASVLVGTQARHLFRARPGTLVLIRPDGYLAARTSDADVLVDYLVGVLPQGAGRTPTLV